MLDLTTVEKAKEIGGFRVGEYVVIKQVHDCEGNPRERRRIYKTVYRINEFFVMNGIILQALLVPKKSRRRESGWQVDLVRLAKAGEFSRNDYEKMVSHKLNACEFAVGNHVKVHPAESWSENEPSHNEIDWLFSKGGNPFAIHVITKLFVNDGTYANFPIDEPIAVLLNESVGIGGWHVPISRLEKT